MPRTSSLKLLFLLPALCLLVRVARSAVLPGECGGEYPSGTTRQLIKSPNRAELESSPSGTQDCVYRFLGSPSCSGNAGRRQEFLVEFGYFDLPASEECRENYLQVGEWNLFCGKVRGARRVPAGGDGDLVIRFHGENLSAGQGFEIWVVEVPCDKPWRFGDQRNDEGTRTTHENPTTGMITQPAEPTAKTITTYHFVPPEDSVANLPSISRSHSQLTIAQEKQFSGIPDPVSAYRTDQPFYGTSGQTPSECQEFAEGGPVPSHCVGLVQNKLQTARPGGGFDELKGGYGYDPHLGLVGGAGQRPGEVPAQDYVPENSGSFRPSATTYPLDFPMVPSQPFPEDGTYSPQFQSQPPQQVPGLDNDGAVSWGGSWVGQDGESGGAFYSSAGFAGGDDQLTQSQPQQAPVSPNNNHLKFFQAELPSPPGGFYPTIGATASGGLGFNFPATGECCPIATSAPRFAISNPGFPSSTDPAQAYSCGYTIRRHSPQVCQLRLRFRFFNFGAEDSPVCGHGFLEVDGRRYCGCRTGHQVVLPFGPGGLSEKRVTVVFHGYPRTKFNGFLVDVEQQSCGPSDFGYGYNGYNYNYPLGMAYPQGAGYYSRPFYGNSPFYRSRKDVGNNGTSSSTTTTMRFPSTRRRSVRDVGYSYPKPTYPQEAPGILGAQTRFFGSCQSRAPFDWVLAAKEAYFRNARCKVYRGPGTALLGFGSPVGVPLVRRNFETTSECKLIGELEGAINSPGFPGNYPDNTNECYRIIRAPGACHLAINVSTFDLEASDGCRKDYVSFSAGRNSRAYCADALRDKQTTFEFSEQQSSHIDVRFVSDKNGTARGFNVQFKQLACRV